MERGKSPEGGRPQRETGRDEPGSPNQAPVLFDRRENPREITDLPGFDISCVYADTEICGRCGAC